MTILLAADAALYRWVTGWPHPWALDQLMLAASALGDHGAIWLVLALVAAAAWRGPAAMAAWRLALAVGLAGLLVDVVTKPAVPRVRPFETYREVRVLGGRPSTHSFPSGHATTAAAGASALTLLWPRRRAVWLALACLIAISRVYLGVHYPSDVIAGAALGWCCARVATAATPART